MMKTFAFLAIATCALFCTPGSVRAEIRIVVEHNPNDQCTPAFKLQTIPRPPADNVAASAKFSIVDGERDDNGGELDVLHNGKLPGGEDQPGDSFFFNAGTDGGRLLVDLTTATEIRQVITYSWHPNTRGPQVYNLYASDGSANGFTLQPKKGVDPEKSGWKLLAKVDTRSASAEPGGQYGVAISDSQGSLGKFRYLLFDISRTENDDGFGNTFYNEIAVLDHGVTGSAGEGPATAPAAYTTHSSDGSCEITIDTSAAPELKQWAEEKLAPVLAEWYPRIVAMLPSDGFTAPARFSVTIRPGDGVAATGGTRVTANSRWLRNQNGEMNAEAVGAILHEEVHVIQQYGRARRNNPNATRSPGWLVEGIPDYIRWFKFEPESHGADLAWVAKRRNLDTIRYDAGYRLSANFLDWATTKYAKDIVRQLNAAMREGKYSPDLWKEQTGHTVQELGDEWKAEITEKARQLKQGG
jgi:hypothetical protein